MILQVDDIVRQDTSETQPLYALKQQRIRIVIADDQRLFRECIAGMLNSTPDFEVVGMAGNGLEAAELARQLVPDVMLLDIKMPHMDGIEVVRQLKTELPLLRFILLTTFVTDGYVLEGLAAGANGYILKDMSTIGLISAIKSVYAGEQVTAPNVAQRMIQLLDKRKHSEGREAHDELTTREMQMLVLMAKGMTVKEIARALSVSEKTVRNHMSNIYHKLNIYDRSQVVLYAVRKGLVDVSEV